MNNPTTISLVVAVLIFGGCTQSIEREDGDYDNGRREAISRAVYIDTVGVGIVTTSTVLDHSGQRIYLLNMWSLKNTADNFNTSGDVKVNLNWWATYNRDSTLRGFYQAPPIGYAVIRMWQTGFHLAPVHADSVRVMAVRENKRKYR